MGFFLFAPCFPWHTFFFTLSICSLSHRQDLYLTPLSPSIYNKIVTEMITMLALKLFYQLDRALQRGLCSPQWHSHWAQPSIHEGFPLYTQAFTSIAIVLMGVYPLSMDGQQGGSCLTQQQGKAVLWDH